MAFINGDGSAKHHLVSYPLTCTVMSFGTEVQMGIMGQNISN